MALMKHRERSPEVVREWPLGVLPSLRLFDEFFRDPDGPDLIRVEEFSEDATLVVRAELPGIDPDKDVEISVADGTLHITAERSDEQQKTERSFHRRELRYGSFARSVVLPEGTDESSVTATYKDGILEVRVPLPAEPPKEGARRVPIARS